MQHAYEQWVITFFIYVSHFISFLCVLHFNRSWRTNGSTLIPNNFYFLKKMSKVFLHIVAMGETVSSICEACDAYSIWAKPISVWLICFLKLFKSLNNEQSQNTFFLMSVFITELHINNCERKTLCCCVLCAPLWKLTIKAHSNFYNSCSILVHFIDGWCNKSNVQ